MAQTYVAGAYQADGGRWVPTINGRGFWASYAAQQSQAAALAAAERAIADVRAKDAVRPAAQAALATYRTRSEIVAAGFVPGWDHGTANVGDLAVVHATGQWRRGVITKVSLKVVTVAVVTPSNPDRVQFAQGRRDNGKTDLYVQP